MRKVLLGLFTGVLLLGLTATLRAAPLSGCVPDPGNRTQTCNLYEEDASGAHSEISWQVPVAQNQFTFTVPLQYLVLLEPGTLPGQEQNPLNWSDVVVFNTGHMQLFSDPFPQNLPATPDQINAGFLGPLADPTAYVLEDPITEIAVYVNSQGDTFIIHSGQPADVVAAPAPATLLLLLAGLAGLAGSRRKAA